ncbi:RCC1 domain-containing protein [Leifsonia poae]|uniref:RCC1 domain-containing protein n=1 Tax=Leifsonia poae TaxID=110933 RepID=UPI001CBBCF6C
MCATSTREVYCWGGAQSNEVAYPKLVPLPAGEVTALSAGQTHSCAVLDRKAAYCWGTNAYGELGRGNTSADSYLAPAPVLQEGTSALPSNAVIEDIAAGLNSTCLIADAKGYCWGDNRRGAVGDDSVVQKTAPVRIAIDSAVPGGVPLISITGSSSESATQRYCAASETDVYCWGSTTNGGLGFSAGQAEQTTPIRIPGLPTGTAQSIDSEWESHCAIINGTSTCWGNGRGGKFGISELQPGYVAQNTVLPAGKTVIKSSGGEGQRCWLFTDGTLECAGNGALGALGRGDDRVSTPNLQPTLPGTPLLCEGQMLSDGRCTLAPGKTYFYRAYFTLGDWRSAMSPVTSLVGATP